MVQCSLILFQQLKINRRYSPSSFLFCSSRIITSLHTCASRYTENYRYSDFICSKLRLSKYFGTPICSGLTRCLIYPIMVFCDEIRELPRNSDQCKCFHGIIREMHALLHIHRHRITCTCVIQYCQIAATFVELLMAAVFHSFRKILTIIACEIFW